MTEERRDPPIEPDEHSMDGARAHTTAATSDDEPPAIAERKAPRPPAASAAARPRRTGVAVALLLAFLALAASAYSIYTTRLATDRFETVRAELESAEAARAALRNALDELAAQQTSSQRQLRAQIDELRGLPDDIARLRDSLADLRSRTQLPEQAWSRAEARVLLDLAARRLTLDRDVATALEALAAADAVLADLDDPEMAAVRTQIAADRQALESVPLPDRVTLAARLAQAEQRAAALPLVAKVAGEPTAARSEPLPDGGIARAWAMVRRAFADLVTVRRDGTAAEGLISADLAAIRRQRLELALYAARAALLRSDQEGYAAALAQASEVLTRHFATQDEEVAALLDELRALAQIDVAPPLPDLSRSARALAAAPGVEAARR